MNSIFFGLIFSMAIPLFYVFTGISTFSLFITSKIIFHRFTRRPQVYDHKINSFVSRAITIALLLHQLTSCYFVNVEDIFPETHDSLISKNKKKVIYCFISAFVFVILLAPKRIASLVRKKRSLTTDELMITEEINSSFGAAPNRELRDIISPKKTKKKEKIRLVR
jgi:hypothetical protein